MRTSNSCAAHAATRYCICWLILVCFASRALAVQLHPGDILLAASVYIETPDDGIFLIDPLTGDRTIISDNTHGTGPRLISANSVMVDADGSLLVADGGNATGQIIRVDPATGNRTLVSSDSGRGSGPSLGKSHDLVVVGDHIIATTEGSTVVSIDPITGNRTIVTGDGVGNGPAFDATAGVVAAGDQLYVANPLPTSSIFRVDLATGDRTIVMTAPNSLERLVQANVDQLYASEIFGHPFDLINLSDGSSTRIIPNISYIGGQTFTAGIALQADRTILLAEEIGPAPNNLNPDTIYAVDPVTADSRIISNGTHGSGPMFISMGGITVVQNVPEPSTFVLAALSLIAFALWRRRK